jgi:glycosyltransferase involved in cell wall biosynthesis
LVYSKQKNQGASVARNHAADLAKGEILLLLDDDILIVPEFLSSMYMIHQKDPMAIVVGNLQSMPGECHSVYEKISKEESATPPPSNGAIVEEIDFTACLGGMTSLRRQAFFEIGKFQDLAQDGRVAWGDLDIGCRAYRAGYKFYRSYPAIGYHDDFSIQYYKMSAKRWERTSATAIKLFQVYPEIQALLPMFTDKRPILWGKDAPSLIIRKVLRRLTSTKIILSIIEWMIEILEKYYPKEVMLKPLYHLGMGGHMFRGYQQGLIDYPSDSTG